MTACTSTTGCAGRRRRPTPRSAPPVRAAGVSFELRRAPPRPATGNVHAWAREVRYGAALELAGRSAPTSRRATRRRTRSRPCSTGSRPRRAGGRCSGCASARATAAAVARLHARGDGGALPGARPPGARTVQRGRSFARSRVRHDLLPAFGGCTRRRRRTCCARWPSCATRRPCSTRWWRGAALTAATGGARGGPGGDGAGAAAAGLQRLAGPAPPPWATGWRSCWRWRRGRARRWTSAAACGRWWSTGGCGSARAGAGRARGSVLPVPVPGALAWGGGSSRRVGPDLPVADGTLDARPRGA